MYKDSNYLGVRYDEHMRGGVHPGALGHRLQQVASHAEPTETEFYFTRLSKGARI